MEKLSHTTESIIDENVEKLAALFPEVVTEIRELDGTLRYVIDADALRERVGDVAEGQRERYQFTWPGKRDAKQEAYRPIDKCLRPCPEESVDWDTTQNLYIEGDNLDALKLLRNTYAGKIKMIYIDPPYNTGNDSFVYDDVFRENEEEFRAGNAAFDGEGNVLDSSFMKNNESNGRFHSDWCSMMYPRLLLARDLLSEDGAAIIAIDDGELNSLRNMADDIFGAANFVGTTVRVSSPSQNVSKFISIMHDYALVYCRNKAENPGGWRVKKNNVEEFESRATRLKRSGLSDSDIAAELRALTKYPRFYDFDHYYYCDEKGVFRAGPMGGVAQGNTETEILHPATGKPCKMPRGGWRYKESEIHKLLNEGKIYFGKDESIVPQTKLYLSDYLLQVPKGVNFFDTQADIHFLLESNIPFDFPKPVSQLVSFLEMIRDKDALILDFFSGSATTAHAVMKLNAEDGGNRKFIMVQLPEVCDEKSEAFKAGYKNICEIGKERIRRAGKKITEEIEEKNKQLKLGEEPKKVPDIGFRVLKIDSSNFEDVSAEPGQITQQALMGLADNLKPGRTAEDILFQVVPQFQIPLSAKIETRDIDGACVFVVDEGRLVACFDQRVPTEVIVEMAKMQPDYAVMRDASFVGDDAVSNFGEIFKTYSSVTITRVV